MILKKETRNSQKLHREFKTTSIINKYTDQHQNLLKTGMIESISAFVTGHPILFFVVVFWIYKLWQSKQPFPKVTGSKVIEVKGLAQWKEQLKKGKDEGKLVMADFFATWCPPCRAAAPIYGQLSIDNPEVIFLKVNVDEVPAVSQLNKISAMPTFKAYINEAEVNSVRGWSESAVRQMVSSKNK